MFLFNETQKNVKLSDISSFVYIITMKTELNFVVNLKKKIEM